MREHVRRIQYALTTVLASHCTGTDCRPLSFKQVVCEYVVAGDATGTWAFPCNYRFMNEADYEKHRAEVHRLAVNEEDATPLAALPRWYFARRRKHIFEEMEIRRLARVPMHKWMPHPMRAAEAVLAWAEEGYAGNVRISEACEQAWKDLAARGEEGLKAYDEFVEEMQWIVGEDDAATQVGGGDAVIQEDDKELDGGSDVEDGSQPYAFSTHANEPRAKRLQDLMATFSEAGHTVASGFSVALQDSAPSDRLDDDVLMD